MVEKVIKLIRDYESGQTRLNIYDLAFMLKEIAEDKLKEEE
ncbi:hypothetical protein HOBO_136 [Bacillus phage Hobo]|uniref:Uncharacterized protein n=2 Tax=Caeruleovirus BM15 TaxID=1985178 RepID=A0A0S2MUI7_9CAUD|nr:hypothetical protein FD732_gp206 [Bacillus phage BM15]ALO79543.1 hypothetical protein BM10_139 [Bacillus phage BM15]AXQ66894.1 hypothetical protein HOBO_136 [Bacillus phage Hobo]